MADRTGIEAKTIPKTFTLGSLSVYRLGFGSMQLTGPGVWGPPKDRNAALRVLQRAVELGVTLIDTADSYGPYVAEELIADALHPYPEGLVIATKAGLARTGPDEWHPLARPEYLRQECEMSLRRLKVDTIDLFQLHRIDPALPLADQIGELAALQKEGKIRHIGLSEVSISQIQDARKIAEIVSVQNLYNVMIRRSEAVLEYCEEEGIAFLPWFPIATGALASEGSPLVQLAKQLDATPAQVALAWLLARSPVLLPIPGTASVEHLEENMQAGTLELSDSDFAEVSLLGVE